MSPADERAADGAAAERNLTDRRGFLGISASVAMAGGLVGGYGAFAAIAGRFLYPVSGETTIWQYVAQVAGFEVGKAMAYTTPAGETVTVARQGPGDGVDQFVALSSTCPHLGCKVHWEGQNDRFFCPCHNGAFSPDGTATEGPPAEAGQSLLKFPLKIENGLLFISVPVEV